MWKRMVRPPKGPPKIGHRTAFDWVETNCLNFTLWYLQLLTPLFIQQSESREREAMVRSCFITLSPICISPALLRELKIYHHTQYKEERGFAGCGSRTHRSLMSHVHECYSKLLHLTESLLLTGSIDAGHLWSGIALTVWEINWKETLPAQMADCLHCIKII